MNYSIWNIKPVPRGEATVTVATPTIATSTIATRTTRYRDLMNTNTAAIVLLAWTRRLGLDDDTLTRADEPHRVADEAADRVRLLHVFGSTVLTGPPGALDRIDPAVLRDPRAAETGTFAAATTAAALARAVGAIRPATTESLWYLDAYGPSPDGAEPLISHDSSDVDAVAGTCPPVDVNEAAVAGLERSFTLLDHAHTPRACSGYAVRDGFLADLRVLTDPRSRRTGDGSTVGRLAALDALDAGLIAQARIHPDNHTARRLAVSVGFAECGWLVTVSPTR
ncbi:hypothetical protein [Speluncibacter jeojiensis]|uniref:Uncharacterized protein n=1 Tax=Speluncibacter jeojiensis TaxID=2710754 RepID=A0A9X4M1X8_9ACTN|nr:hypothetical protein [Corynebacteriales bacterium D3-21]